VNKYIGETGKNPKRVVNTVAVGGAKLLFEESHALFGRRSEVPDAHDRHANMEINYLMQRLEGIGGLVIPTTSLKCATG